ncbi:hypothetical protein Bccel_0964 [Pseudobacteroides cellulosolvens ATCC 35603 = DSM 2933]|uniref:Uncharacterized protein n=1 Tax=Pseudobacteroides cellulosolvens ATCC 35603 = DSM 2933 TaxID=398512 RepID=A0A0L6JIW5_9FIRM|nr:hypothetical protein Bccel_0949 [Pseudobacteroides cellulosolvens ATCC 35603 = DSM 2933]KNY25704.1 hypothetical protein Bccel_0964 [Pseudobacteroides cellulosolvens ATCC 35603 = DSM 2933]
MDFSLVFMGLKWGLVITGSAFLLSFGFTVCLRLFR